MRSILASALLAYSSLVAAPAFADPFVFQLEGGIIDKKDTYAVPTWDTVALKYAYEQPVILAIPNTNGDNPADFRIRNVGKTSFEVTLVEPPSEDGPHVAMSVAYVAVEAGKWSLPDGRKVAAGFVDTSQLVHAGGGGFQSVNLPIGFFAKPPVVFAQIQGLANETANVPSKPSSPWLTTALRNVTAKGFELALDGCQCSSQPLGKPERVGWVAIEAAGPGSFVDSDLTPVSYESQLTGAIVDGWDDKGVTVPFQQAYAKPPLFVARMQARTDADGGWLRYFALGTKSVGLVVDEDRCGDAERKHSPEPAALFVFSQSFRVQDADPDKDGFASSVDVCPLDFDPTQADTDKDGRGDACDCGDGILAAIEFCDDAGVAGGDGCSATCEVESGYACSGAPSTCAPICGDGLVRGQESCDDAGVAGGDGCSATCEVESGYACGGEPSTCAPICGDGLLRGQEGCDDGNEAVGDGCAACAAEPGWSCAGEPSTCTTTCGDGIVAGSEFCDDGNTQLGDGCSDCYFDDPSTGPGPTTTATGAGGATATAGAGGGDGGGDAQSCAYGPCTPDTILNGRACGCALPGRGDDAGLASGALLAGALGLAYRRRRVARAARPTVVKGER